MYMCQSVFRNLLIKGRKYFNSTLTQVRKIGSPGLHVANSVGRNLKKERERKETAMESNLLFALLTIKKLQASEKT